MIAYFLTTSAPGVEKERDSTLSDTRGRTGRWGRVGRFGNSGLSANNVSGRLGGEGGGREVGGEEGGVDAGVGAPSSSSLADAASFVYR